MKNIHNIKENIYITSDEEIKEGDWFVVELFKITGESDGFHIEKCTKLDGVWCNNFDVISTRHKDNCKKIILAQDQDLIKDGVQAIDDEFLEWFVKNPSCEFVKVRKEKYSERFDNDKSPIGNPDTWGKRLVDDVPKEESCDNCNNEICCCIIRTQETLEEVAERLYPYELGYGVFDRNCEIDIERERFVEGAKWQQEQCKKK